jgi:hypothetical protein
LQSSTRHLAAMPEISSAPAGASLQAWLRDFERTQGRPLRVLHIGNLANNAFKNSLALRACGVECDVMCNDYYHAMASPEWECADFLLSDVNMASPDWRKHDLGGYQRPRWFAQGAYGTCLDYLIAKNEERPEADCLWEVMEAETRSGGKEITYMPATTPIDALSAQLIAQRLSGQHHRLGLQGALDADRLFAVYQSIFYDKTRLDRLFKHYDVVVGYALGGLYPLVSGEVPYIAYEHGTIRELPFTQTPAGDLCALIYRAASNVAITNCDNIVAAKRLGLQDFRFVPHAILEDWNAVTVSDLRATLSDHKAYDFLLFHPARQHWTAAKSTNWEKGNDLLIRGFAAFVKTARPKARLIMVEWGETVEASQALVADLGIAHNVLWVQPMSVRRVGMYVSASDALADQFIIGAWGALMPIGLMLGKPSLIYVNEDVHRWCFAELPPVLNCRTEEDIRDALQKLIEPQTADGISRRSREWYDKYHSMAVVGERMLDAIRAAVDGNARGRTTYGLEPPVHWLGTRLVNLDERLQDATSKLSRLEEKQRLLEEKLNSGIRQKARSAARKLRLAVANRLVNGK